MSFMQENTVKAVRKDHQCCACRTVIKFGEPAVRYTGISDGDFIATIYHPDCRAAEIAYNRDCGLAWDDWYSLDEAVEDDALEWLSEKYPSVAARFAKETKP